LGDELFATDWIITGDRSRMAMLVGDRIEIQMRERSVVEFREARPRWDLLTGQIVLDVDRERLRSGEVVDVRTPNTVVSVRGTRIVVEVFLPPQAGEPITTLVEVLSGAASVVIARGGGPAIDLSSNQGVTITGDVAGPIRPRRTLSLPTK
jgi:ferric-dicitrate binding protein FerR (iron transport regulator)